ncbi:hypothetical protein GMB70_14155 [Turicibacter sanguinis]|nr:hypothetical protein [Turicibacter sanguinis]
MKFNLLIATLCAVFTLSACGESEVQEKPKQPETSAQQDTNSIEPEEAPKEEKPKEEAITRYSLGDTLTVSEDGVDLYEITFDKAFLTEDRNQFSEKEVDHVVVLEYTYKNLNQEDGTYIVSGLDYKVYDSAGKLLETYPAGTTLYGDTVSVGRTSTSQEAFGYTGDANQTLEVEIYASGFSAKPIAIVEVQPQ